MHRQQKIERILNAPHSGPWSLDGWPDIDAGFARQHEEWRPLNMEECADGFEIELFKGDSDQCWDAQHAYKEINHETEKISMNRPHTLIHALPNRKTCAGDQLVAEMLMALMGHEKIMTILLNLLNLHLKRPQHRQRLGDGMRWPCREYQKR